VLCVLFGVEERAAPEGKARAPVRWRELGQFGRPFWTVTFVGVAFTLARFSEAFLILRAHAEGLPIALAPLVLVVMNVVYALGAYPAGALADRVRPRGLLLWGIAALIAADLALALIPNLIGAFAGIALWGVHMAMTQGLFAKLVADNAPERLRASGFGVFNLATGVTLLAASVIAGLAWDSAGASATFLLGAGFALFAGVLALMAMRRAPLPATPYCFAPKTAALRRAPILDQREHAAEQQDAEPDQLHALA